jgi:hypothetical protein
MPKAKRPKGAPRIAPCYMQCSALLQKDPKYKDVLWDETDFV